MKSAVFYVDAHVHNHVHIHVLEYQEEYNDRKGVVGLDQLYAADVHDDNDADDIDAAPVPVPALAVGIDIDVARKETAMSMWTSIVVKHIYDPSSKKTVMLAC